jgi:hypothetical protein
VDVPMGWWSRKLLSVTGPLRGAIVRNASPAVPQRLRLQITAPLIGEMMNLILRMQKSLAERRQNYAKSRLSKIESRC